MNVIKEATDQPLSDQKAAGGLWWAEGLGRAGKGGSRERDGNQKKRREEVKEAHSQMEPFYF